jgi:hypothetical protein
MNLDIESQQTTARTRSQIIAPPIPAESALHFIQAGLSEQTTNLPARKGEPINDPTETIRRQRIVEINAEPGSREALQVHYGQVWDTEQLSSDFKVIGFMAPFVGVERKSDGQKGSIEFQHSPRFYFNFVSHDEE